MNTKNTNRSLVEAKDTERLPEYNEEVATLRENVELVGEFVQGKVYPGSSAGKGVRPDERSCTVLARPYFKNS